MLYDMYKALNEADRKLMRPLHWEMNAEAFKDLQVEIEAMNVVSVNTPQETKVFGLPIKINRELDGWKLVASKDLDL